MKKLLKLYSGTVQLLKDSRMILVLVCDHILIWYFCIAKILYSKFGGYKYDTKILNKSSIHIIKNVYFAKKCKSRDLIVIGAIRFIKYVRMAEEVVAVKSSSNIANVIQKYINGNSYRLWWLDWFSFIVCVHSKLAMMVYFLFPSVSIVRPRWFLQK